MSASRRTDLVRWYPGDLVRLLGERYPPEDTHSVVVVTKFPEAILAEPVRSTLARYDQVMAQVTITGLGGTALEPRVPPAEQVLRTLPRLVNFLGRPERVVVRVDPIVHWRQAPGAETKSNLSLFAGLVGECRQAGIPRVKTSLVTPYPKAVRRFAAAGLELVDLQGSEREQVLRRLEREAQAAGVRLEFCCEPTRPRAACIDAALLTTLHPLGLPARPDRAAGQRQACGCSHSVDLAWYSSHPCPSGCLYCYANPIVPGRKGPKAGPAAP